MSVLHLIPPSFVVEAALTHPAAFDAPTVRSASQKSLEAERTQLSQDWRTNNPAAAFSEIARSPPSRPTVS
jgi:hypothetical protein